MKCFSRKSSMRFSNFSWLFSQPLTRRCYLRNLILHVHFLTISTRFLIRYSRFKFELSINLDKRFVFRNNIKRNYKASALLKKVFRAVGYYVELKISSTHKGERYFVLTFGNLTYFKKHIFRCEGWHLFRLFRLTYLLAIKIMTSTS